MSHLRIVARFIFFFFFFLVFVAQELFLSHNVIEILPESINKLTNLGLLDVSHNKLKRIDQIGFMPNLRILNISGNANLTKLPIQLTTCDSLVDIVLDAEFILYPPADVIESGTAEILKYLLERNGPHEVNLINSMSKPAQNIKQVTANMLDVERGTDIVRVLNTTNEKYSRENVSFKNDRQNISYIYCIL